MVFTLNYYDLQNIKEQLKKERIKNTRKIYFCIETYKETINYIFKNNLARNFSKQDLEDDLQDFANSLLQNTKLSYKQLEQLYRPNVLKNYNINPNEIKLKL